MGQGLKYEVNTKAGAALMLNSAAKHIESTEYSRRKASILLHSLAEVVFAEMYFESNLADIGFNGCTE